MKEEPINYLSKQCGFGHVDWTLNNSGAFHSPFRADQSVLAVAAAAQCNCNCYQTGQLHVDGYGGDATATAAVVRSNCNYYYYSRNDLQILLLLLLPLQSLLLPLLSRVNDGAETALAAAAG